MSTANTTIAVAAEPKPIGIANSLGLILIFLGGTFVYGFAEAMCRLAFGLKIGKSDSVFLSMLVAWPLTLLAGVYFSREAKQEPFPHARVRSSTFLWLGLAVVGMVPIVADLIALIPMPESIRRMFQEITSAKQVVLWIMVVVFAPVVEELFFRGILLSNFLARYSRVKSIWATAILFTLFHMNPWQAVVALPLGLLLAWAVVRTRSIVPAILGHMLCNFTSVINAMVRGHGSQIVPYSLPVVIGSLAAMVFGIYMLNRSTQEFIVRKAAAAE